MNQTNPHFTQWKNLTKEQKDEYDFEGYRYNYQAGSGIWQPFIPQFAGKRLVSPEGQYVYRLVIEPDKYYYVSCSAINKGVPFTSEGLSLEHYLIYDILRPARISEIPKPKRSFKDGAYYPVIYLDGEQDIARYFDEENTFDTIVYNVCKLKAFSWIGEELKIVWGKG